MGQFKKVIEDYYNSKPKKVYRDLTPSASMLGACPRASWAKLRGVPETTPPDVHAMQNFEVGNVTEAVVARAFDQTGNLISWWTDSQDYGATFNQKDWKGKLRDDQWFDKELNVTGTPDLIAKIEDKTVLVDVKTASTFSTSMTVKEVTEGTFWENKLGYKLQLGCYMYLMKRRFEAGLEDIMPDYGKLIIIDKNNGAVIAEPTLFYDEQLEIQVHNAISTMNQLVKSESIPMCDCAVGHKRFYGVAYCNYGCLDSMKEGKKGRISATRCCDENYIKSNICK